MIKRKHKSKIKHTLIKYFLIYLFSLTIVSNLLIYALTTKSAIEKTEEIYNELAYQIAERLDLTLDNINNTAVGIMFNSNIQGMLINPKVLQKYEDNNIISSVLFDFRNFIDVGNIVIFSLDGKVLTASEGYDSKIKIQDFNWYTEAEKSKGQSIWTTSHVDQGDYKYKSEYVITLVKKIRYIDTLYNVHTGDDLGYIMVNVSEKELNDIITEARVEKNNTFYIVDGSGSIISNSNPEMVGKIGINPKARAGKGVYFDYKSRQMVILHPLSISDWYLVGTVPWIEITNNNHVIFNLMIILAGIESVIFIGVAIVFSNRISKPLHQLYTSMGNINNVIALNHSEYDISNITEIDSLVEGYQDLITRLKFYTEEVYEAKIRENALRVTAKEAELEALQHQINPHFLYNTLDSINWMASLEGNEEVVEMVTRLGELLRYSMGKEAYVTIAEEIDNVQNYIYIQSVRYDNKFLFVKEIDPKVLSYDVMRLILQPIIENAVLHGTHQIEYQGIITLRITEENAFVVFVVSDNGIGMSEETLHGIREKLQVNSHTEHIGLSNVYERLKLNYQSDLVFHIDSELGAGTTITIKIPKSR